MSQQQEQIHDDIEKMATSQIEADMQADVNAIYNNNPANFNDLVSNMADAPAYLIVKGNGYTGTESEWLDYRRNVRDAGLLAQAKMKRKEYYKGVRRRFKQMCLLVLGLVITFIAFLVWAGIHTKETGYSVDQRTCFFEGKNRNIEGYRTYSYPHTTVFGIRFNEMAKVKEKTFLKVTGEPITIIGLNKKGKPEVQRISRGSVGNAQPLNFESEQYLFVFDNEEIALSRNELCK